MEFTIVGAGVVGLAIARALAQRFPRHAGSILVLEQESSFGLGVSARSSEVVHAGIYYPAGSYKAKFCVEGRKQLVQYCRDRNIALENRGKLLVATSAEQRGKLGQILASARANGVDDLEELSPVAARRLEPELSCEGGALLSPSTSVVDSRAYMQSLEAEAMELGVTFAYGNKLVGFTQRDGFSIQVEHLATRQRAELRTKHLINCAGLQAPALAGVPQQQVDGKRYCKGNYFKTQTQRVPFTRLIYPIPEAHGLGVHLTIDVHGNARFGPDVEWTTEMDFTVDERRAQYFYELIKQYWPALRHPGELVPDYAAFRPKYEADFAILDERAHGTANLVHLLGIESPGLTSSLALAQHITLNCTTK